MSYYRYGRRGLDTAWHLIIANGIFFLFTYVTELINPFFYNYQILPLVALEPDLFITRPWTLLTSMFVHGGITHILFNMLALYFFGEYLSSIVGEKKFFWVYFIGGIVGGLFFVLFAYTLMPGLLDAAAVGASGAIYAVGGALAVMRPNARVMIFPFPVPSPLWLAILIGLLVIAPGVAWQAHLGGVLTGLVMGFIFRKQGRRYY
jgi:membrane associated rhomboid family serine protease